MKRGGLSYCGIKTLRDTIVLIQRIGRIMYSTVHIRDKMSLSWDLHRGHYSQPRRSQKICNRKNAGGQPDAFTITGDMWPLENTISPTMIMKLLVRPIKQGVARSF